MDERRQKSLLYSVSDILTMQLTVASSGHTGALTGPSRPQSTGTLTGPSRPRTEGPSTGPPDPRAQGPSLGPPDPGLRGPHQALQTPD
ncbi:unnamed protein product [Gadus morhua 'NCC']